MAVNVPAQSIANIKQALNGLGYNVGPVDGNVEGPAGQKLRAGVQAALADLSNIMGIEPAPTSYNETVGGQLIAKIHAKKSEFGTYPAMQAFAKGDGFLFYTNEDLKAELVKKKFTPQLIQNIKGVLALMDNEVSFVNDMNAIAPALVAQAAPAAPASTAANKPAPAPAAQPQQPAPTGSAEDVQALEQLLTLHGEKFDAGQAVSRAQARIAEMDKDPAQKEQRAMLYMGLTLRLQKMGLLEINGPTVAQNQAPQNPAGDNTQSETQETSTGGNNQQQTGGAENQQSSQAQTPPPPLPDPPPLKNDQVATDILKGIFNGEIKNAKLLDWMLLSYCRYSSTDLGFNFSGVEKEHAPDPRKRLEEAFVEAFKADPDSEHTKNDIKGRMHAMMLLAFGKKERRDAFQLAFDKAFDVGFKIFEADNSKIDEAAAKFTTEFYANNENINSNHGPGKYQPEPLSRDSRGGIDPFLPEGITRVRANEIMEDYDRVHTGKWAGQHQAFVFSEGGHTYIVGRQKTSGIGFLVEARNLDKLEQALHDGLGDTNRATNPDEFRSLRGQNAAVLARLIADPQNAGFRFAMDNFNYQFSHTAFIAQAKNAPDYDTMLARMTQAAPASTFVVPPPAAPQRQTQPVYRNVELNDGTTRQETVVNVGVGSGYSKANAVRWAHQVRDQGLEEDALVGAPSVMPPDTNGRIHMKFRRQDVWDDMQRRRIEMHETEKQAKEIKDAPAHKYGMNKVAHQAEEIKKLESKLYDFVDITDDLDNYQHAKAEPVESEFKSMMPHLLQVSENYRVRDNIGGYHKIYDPNKLAEMALEELRKLNPQQPVHRNGLLGVFTHSSKPDPYAVDWQKPAHGDHHRYKNHAHVDDGGNGGGSGDSKSPNKPSKRDQQIDRLAPCPVSDGTAPVCAPGSQPVAGAPKL